MKDKKEPEETSEGYAKGTEEAGGNAPHGTFFAQYRKTIHRIFVYVICLILAFLTWLVVTEEQPSDKAQDGTATTAMSETVDGVWEL